MIFLVVRTTAIPTPSFSVRIASRAKVATRLLRHNSHLRVRKACLKPIRLSILNRLCSMTHEAGKYFKKTKDFSKISRKRTNMATSDPSEPPLPSPWMENDGTCDRCQKPLRNDKFAWRSLVVCSKCHKILRKQLEGDD